MKAEVIHVGDFVNCRSRYYRSQLQLPAELGLVIEIQRSNYKILYPEDKRCWLPRDAVSRSQSELSNSAFLRKLHFLLRRVDADEFELVTVDGVHRLSARIDQIDHVTLDELRTFLGDTLISIVIVPEGMAFIRAEIHFRQ